MYKTLIGLKADLSKPALVPEILSNKSNDLEIKIDKEKNVKFLDESDDSGDDSDGSYDGTEDDDSEEGSEDDQKESRFVNSARPKNETTEERKVLINFFWHVILNHYKNLILYFILGQKKRNKRTAGRKSKVKNEKACEKTKNEIS